MRRCFGLADCVIDGVVDDGVDDGVDEGVVDEVFIVTVEGVGLDANRATTVCAVGCEECVEDCGDDCGDEDGDDDMTRKASSVVAFRADVVGSSGGKSVNSPRSSVDGPDWTGSMFIRVTASRIAQNQKRFGSWARARKLLAILQAVAH